MPLACMFTTFIAGKLREKPAFQNFTGNARGSCGLQVYIF